MTHNEERAHWLKEGALGLSTGILYGLTSVAVGHPFGQRHSRLAATPFVVPAIAHLDAGAVNGCSLSLCSPMRLSLLLLAPADTVKTKMQAQSGFLEGGGTLQALRKVWRAEGVRGLYRGWIPPLWGSGLYRSTQFAVFEALFTKWDANRISSDPLVRPAFAADDTRRVNLNTVIPGTFGLETRVVEAALCASFARSVIESPIEYAKVARQTGQSWALRSVYTGFGPQFVRTAGVMTTYFVLIDSIRRHAPGTFANPLGQFLASSCSATLGFWIVWPAEVLKNQVQARTPIYAVEELRNRGITGAQIARACNGVSNAAAAAALTSPSAAVVAAASPSAAAAVAAAAAAAAAPSASFLPSPLASPTLADRARYLLFTHGIAGLYRGIGPGTARSMLSNGVSMIVMLHAQRKITEWGWRN